MGLFKPNVRKLAEKRDVEGLVKALCYEKDEYVRRDASEALGEIGDTQAVESLIETLKDKDEYVRKATAIPTPGLGLT
jgi:HEAT repeat protein